MAMNKKFVFTAISIIFSLVITGCSSSNIDSSKIGIEKAKEIAFDHAQVSDTNNVLMVKIMESSFDQPSGQIIYEIDFVHKNTEYSYDIDLSGRIISAENDIEDFDFERYQEVFPNDS